ncbi:hypothetical protein NA56DRAFT_632302 [Hyaloscypha hepaticicola]|uniref:CFEM domain-containing protein n=1 Tax=Hyaloscypha hepaticicola TaxID=2082293 RepID=A0A2J6PT47_9HELO|nr:hypothetical protein NA56DRAFT_632302 [Hyaloscypha hepaticicola]
MKGLTGIAVGILALMPLGIAQSSLPSCATACLDSALQNSTCSATDQACICADAALNAKVSICVQSSCNVKEQLTTINLSSIACSAPVRNKAEVYRNLGIVFYTLSTMSIALRFIARFIKGMPIWYDDWLMVLIFLVTNNIPVNNGVGQDIWKVPFNSITKFLLFLWVIGPIYFMEISLIKIAFLLFYLRIFQEERFRRILSAFIFVNIVTGIALAVVSFFTCRPISYYWNRWDMEHVGHCVSSQAIAFAGAGIGIVLDIVTLILPLTQVWNLPLGLKKRIGVILMFSVGAFVTIVSILRLKSLLTVAKSANPTWDFVEGCIWSIIELDVGIICACMPSFRIILIRIFPRLGSTPNSSDPQFTTGNQSGMEVLQSNTTKSGISYSRDSGNYTMKPAQDDSNFMQCVEIRAVPEESYELVLANTTDR